MKQAIFIGLTLMFAGAVVLEPSPNGVWGGLGMGLVGGGLLIGLVGLLRMREKEDAEPTLFDPKEYMSTPREVWDLVARFNKTPGRPFNECVGVMAAPLLMQIYEMGQKAVNEDALVALEAFLQASTDEFLYQTGQFSRTESPPSNYPPQGSMHGGLAAAGILAHDVLAKTGE